MDPIQTVIIEEIDYMFDNGGFYEYFTEERADQCEAIWKEHKEEIIQGITENFNICDEIITVFRKFIR